MLEVELLKEFELLFCYKSWRFMFYLMANEVILMIEFFLQLLASLNRCFIESFITLNIINFVNMVTREKDEVS